ncbi:MAG: hypothetical protein ACREA0_32325 [bacterium]
MARRAKPFRTIEVRQVSPDERGDQRAQPCQWEVMIPLQFCKRTDAIVYAQQMTLAGNQLNPKVRTRWILIEGPPRKTR